MVTDAFNEFDSSIAQISPQQEPEINLLYFVDLDNDLVGWYSLGHHDPDEFFAAVSEHNPDSLFLRDRVQLAWAKFADRRFELCHFPEAGFQPITYVEGMD